MSETPIFDEVKADQYFDPSWPTAKVMAARPWSTRAGKARKARRETSKQ